MPADRKDQSPKKTRSTARAITIGRPYTTFENSLRIRQNLDARAPIPNIDQDEAEAIKEVVQGQRIHKFDPAACPPVMVNQLFRDDPYNKCIYVGSGAGDIAELKRDLWRLDLETLTWENLTDRLMHIDSDRFSTNTISFDQLQHGNPSWCIMRTRGPGSKSLLVMFGGYCSKKKKALSDLIMVDPERRWWWKQAVEGRVVEGRMSPAIVAIGERLFIFGGYRNFVERESGSPIRSYSIAVRRNDKWHWECQDVPYPAMIPQSAFFGKAVAVYGDVKIFLGPGRTTFKPAAPGTEVEEPLNLTLSNTFYFHVERQKFQHVELEEEALPKQLAWYCMFPQAHFSPRMPHPSSVLTCGWVTADPEWGDEDVLVPEIWRLDLTPTEKVVKMNIAPLIYKLDTDLRAVVIRPKEKRVLFFGPSSKSKVWDTLVEFQLPTDPY